jgi:catechol 2,3-dioxygenase-like lactoylglutathione lyase family enzyme
MAKAFNILKLDHGAYVVSSLKDAMAFWVEGMGAEVERTGKSGGEPLRNITGAVNAEVDIAMIRIGGQRIELLEYHGVTPENSYIHRPYDAGAMHIALRVDDIDAALQVAARYGYRAQGKPQRSQLGAMITYVVGPDGATVEFMQPLPG